MRIVTFPAAHLRRARNRAGLTIKRASEAAGVSTSLWSYVEGSEVQPTWPRAVAMWGAVGVKVELVENANRDRGDDVLSYETPEDRADD